MSFQKQRVTLERQHCCSKRLILEVQHLFINEPDGFLYSNEGSVRNWCKRCLTEEWYNLHLVHGISCSSCQKEGWFAQILRGLQEVERCHKKDAYALPWIDDTLDALAGLKWFSTLDLASGYWQVGMHPDDRENTAFCTADGLFEFNVMPFGLCNAPATFQRLMDLILAGLQWSACLVYLDDIIIMGKSLEEHLE